MFVGLCGRKHSGKSTAAKLLVEKGFQKVSFAGYLKKIVSQLYGWVEEDLYSEIKKEELLPEPVVWDERTRRILSEITDVELPISVDHVEFHRRRDALTFIGVDVLRGLDPDFHVKKLKELCSDPNENYVCDDLRFPNELAALREMNAQCVYIMRPYHWEYSNHSSEVSLGRTDFEYVLVNDGSQHKLLRKFGMFIDTLLAKHSPPITRSELVGVLKENAYSTARCARRIGCSNDKILWWTTKHMIPLSGLAKYKVDHDCFAHVTPKAAYYAGLLAAAGCIKKHLKHSYLLELSATDPVVVEGFREFAGSDKPICSHAGTHRLAIRSPWIVNDLKLWDVVPQKTGGIPDLVKTSDDLLRHWVAGLTVGNNCTLR